jgi:CBS domain-containing protein
MLPLAVVPVLSGEESLEEALAALSRGMDRGLVVDDGHVTGVLSLADLARAVQSRSPSR